MNCALKVGRYVKLLPYISQRQISKEEQRRSYGAVSYHEDTTYPEASGYKNDEEVRIVAGKPIFYGEDRRQNEDGMDGGGEKRSKKEEQIMAKRGDKVVDKNGMR